MSDAWEYDECGLRGVELVGGFEVVDTPYGEAVRIQDVEGLHRAIGRELAHKAGVLSGRELKFLRTEMDMTQRSLAEMLQVETRTLQRWEADGDRNGVTKQADALIRTLYLEFLDETSPIRDILARLSEDANHEMVLRMSNADGGWGPAAPTKDAA